MCAIAQSHRECEPQLGSVGAAPACCPCVTTRTPVIHLARRDAKAVTIADTIADTIIPADIVTPFGDRSSLFPTVLRMTHFI